MLNRISIFYLPDVKGILSVNIHLRILYDAITWVINLVWLCELVSMCCSKVDYVRDR